MVRWGDCDTAGIIYTPKAIDYALETIENWLIEENGISWMDIKKRDKAWQVKNLIVNILHQ